MRVSPLVAAQRRSDRLKQEQRASLALAGTPIGYGPHNDSWVTGPKAVPMCAVDKAKTT